MKILCSMNDQDFDKIKNHIDCREWANPIEDEFIFYEPTDSFLIMLALYEIKYHQSN
jgi:hypothetical protein